MVYHSNFPIFAVAVDLCIFSVRSEEFCVLVVTRGEPPFGGQLALPGGFVRPDESLEEAAARELLEETGVSLDHVALEQLRSYGAPDRDPRPERVVSVAYIAFLPDLPKASGGGDARHARWIPVSDALEEDLAFDHSEILVDGVDRARSKLEYTTLAARFCAEEFTLGELQDVYEAVWDQPLDARNFRRKVLAVPGFVVETDNFTTGVGRPARLYRRGDATAIYPPLQLK